jgi:hypothetical protein
MQVEKPMSFAIYIVGFVTVIGGLIYAAVILHLATHWIVVGTVVLLGIAIVKGVSATRQKDPS